MIQTSSSPVHWGALRRSVTALGLLLLAMKLLPAADWPTWRHDAARSASSPEELPTSLHLQWVLELPGPRPAWPSTQEKLQFDRLYEPVLMGKLLYVPSMIQDKLSAHDTGTGEEKWSFYAEGPIRFAPVAWRDRVFFVSDDGQLYCLDAASGTLLWKFRGGPSARKVLGQGRLISMWPARGAPVVYGRNLYFAASIWPFMGTFLYSIDATTGAVNWVNSGTGSRYTEQQHNSPAFAGVAPQGYLAATEDYLLVSGGRTVPAIFDRRSGKLLYYGLASRATGSKGGGGYEVFVGPNHFINRGYLYHLGTGGFVTSTEATVIGQDEMYGASGGELHSWASRFRNKETTDRRGNKRTTPVVDRNWKADLEERIERVFLRSGSRLYAGRDRSIFAVDLPRDDGKARISWKERLVDTPLNMLSGDEKLFVMTNEGRIYCFGGHAPDDRPDVGGLTELVPRGAVWKYFDEGSDLGTDWGLPSFDDGPWPAGPAQLGYGDGDEATTLSFGDDAGRKPLTCYFRHAFKTPSDVELGGLTLRILVDDGAVLYLNGREVARLFMPEGEIDYRTPAARTVESDEFHELELPVEHLRQGENLLAVEVHQTNRRSSDISLDLELLGKQRKTEPVPELPRDDWTEIAARILETTGRLEGYCLVLGIGTGRLAEELAVQSELHVIVLDDDSGKLDAYRRRLDTLGLYGTRISAVTGQLTAGHLPSYLADLVVTEERGGGAATRDESSVGELFRILRPFSGTACFLASDANYGKLETVVAGARLDHGKLERRGDLAWIRRLRAPTGSGEWTHQNGDAGNTVSSSERLVKLPLGVLWFGGPSHDGILPRHGHGPTPQVVDGRLFIEGRNILRALDIYTGRLLWEKQLEDVGAFYDYTSHEPGANAIGSNYVSLSDGVYIVHQGKCLRLDPTSGNTLAVYSLPPESGATEAPEWGYIGAWGPHLVAGARPTGFVAASFTARELGSIKGDALKAALKVVETWKDFEPVRRQGRQSDHDLLAANLNKLLCTDDMASRIPEGVRKRGNTSGVEERLQTLRAQGHGTTSPTVRVLRRVLLSRCYNLPEFQLANIGTTGSYRRTGSRRLVGLERSSGRALWDFEAKSEFRHNAIALGGGRVFCIDRLSPAEEGFYRRRGIPVKEKGRVLSLDIRTGEVLWEYNRNVFGTWLAYSEEHDVLLQAGSRFRDRLSDEADRGLEAYRGTTGDVLWTDKELSYDGPCMIIGDRIVTQPDGSPGFFLSLLSGEKILRRHPLSGAETAWTYTRNYGCNTAVGCPHLITFRSAAAGYYDLEGDSGTGNFGGFRSGCTSNLIPAGGILNAPDYTRTCTCSYQNQVSLALVHMPEVETWTFQTLSAPATRVTAAGLNFGAPGDRRGPDGTLWLDYPSTGGPSPDLPVKNSVESPEYVRHHVSRMEGGELRWVGASGIIGGGDLEIGLGDGAGEETYRVRLVFAEIAGLGTGARVFDVALQDQVVLEAFDIAREAGGPFRTVVREFTGVLVGERLRITLGSRGSAPPLLCGVQVLAGSSDSPSP